jgi:hypothetical protein
MIDDDVLSLKWGGDSHRVEVRGSNYWHYNTNDPLHRLIDQITGNISDLMNGAEIPIFAWYPEYAQLTHLLRDQVAEATANYYDSMEGEYRQITAPDYLYHATNADNLASISQSGLVANGPTGNTINFPRLELESTGRIFLTASPGGAQHYFDNSVVLQVNAAMVPQLTYYGNYNGDDEYVSPGPIPPGALIRTG